VPNALELLTNDHREIDALFERYRGESDDQSAHQIFERLALHSAMEHLVLYPEVRRLVDGGDDLIDRAEAEHSALQELTASALATPPADLRPLVNELEDQVRAHVEFEETEMFPGIAESGADLEHLADAMEQVRNELTENGSSASVRTRRNV
jgi:hemerythrin superfamily protein